ncbi:PTS sugar transporter subunit IIA [Mycetocola zhujimingii]|uniref:PTS sugar transporter subunit IIA n=1 Tax=Mycetocola zhujimingii TaxID=2079792 RepID=UPI000D39CA9C|nr:PTS sugar transporter subunit IIA [Mycetocola zhujimingii]AWB85766.1 PTS ascorbate transporter subunit IIA [Mycetocola zhujimingii]
MTLPPLPDSAVELGRVAHDWREAIRITGDALVKSGVTQPGYTDRMIDVIEEFGAYIVIAPGLALAHARPGADVRREGLAVVTLAEPVAFGHPHNDPVNVILGLAVTTPESHVTSVAALANVFNDASAIPAVAAATTADAVRAVLGASQEEAA